jgi:flavin-dependent dehydrogenase
LHKKAIDNGAEFKHEKVENTEYDDYCVKVTTEKSVYETRVLIIANGVYSKFPKRFGLQKPYDATTVGLTYNSETKMSDKKINDFMGEKRLTTIFFGVVKRGYGWVFPMKGKINIGVGCTKKYFKKVPKVYDQFLETIKDYFDISKLKLSEPRGYVVPFKEPMKKTFADRVMVVGDAAWMVSGLTAEGISYALKSGKLAAETAVEALRASNTSEAFLERYQIKWKEDYGNDLSKYSTRLQNILYKNNKRMELVVKMAANDEKMLDIMTDTITGSISYKEAFNSMLKRGFISLAKSL